MKDLTGLLIATAIGGHRVVTERYANFGGARATRFLDAKHIGGFHVPLQV